MAKSRPEKTLADYVAIAISPALIMVLVGSLVFFLLEVAYTGEFAARFKWILFWFVFAAVLIARIGIEEGDEHAIVFTIAFWGAVSLVVFKFLDKPLAGFFLLGVVWWCAKKLTWDCTLIDDNQDASGQGLLQITGLDPGDEDEADSPADDPVNDDKLQLLPEEDDEEPDGEKSAKKETERPHAPGLWVVYFSLAALPLFGMGQLFIPAADQARRSSAFRYLWFYVAAGLGLLLTTSFLGLRRYLRQRKLTMPLRMTGQWIGMGAMLAVGILIVCLILPRPNAAYSMTKLVDVVSEKIGKASDYAFGSDDAGKGEGRRSGREAKDEENQPQGEGQKGNQGQQAGQTSKSNQPAGGGDGKKEGASQTKGGQQKQPGEGDKSGQPQGNKAGSDQKNDAGNKANQQQGQEQNGKSQANGGHGEPHGENRQGESSSQQSSSPPSSVGSQVAKLVKWLIYLALAIAAVFLAMRYWSVIREGLLRLWNDLKELFAGLFGGKPKDSAGDADAEAMLPERLIRPFADYANPFRNGRDQHMSTIELIEYTYDAMLAYGAEVGSPKRADQTPTEYLQELAMRDPDLARELRPVAMLYLQAAFSDTPPNSKCHRQLKQAWSSLDTAASLPG